jgi:hypothetical protein
LFIRAGIDWRDFDCPESIRAVSIIIIIIIIIIINYYLLLFIIIYYYLLLLLLRSAKDLNVEAALIASTKQLGEILGRIAKMGN